jgi:putative ABC transport system permease protein
MKAQDLLELAARNLRESKLRNSLTTLGIAVGVAALVAMLALGVGLQELASNRLSRSGLFDAVVVFSRPEFRRMDAGESRPGPPPVRNLRPLDDAVRAELAKLPNVVEVIPEIRFNCEIRYNEQSHFASVGGLSPRAASDDAFDDMKGQFFSSPDAAEAILQIRFARQLDPNPDSLLGKELLLRFVTQQAPQEAESRSNAPAEGSFSFVRGEQKVRIVGIVESEPFGGFRGMGGGRLFVPLALAEKLNAVGGSSMRDLLRSSPGQRTYQALVVRVSHPSHVQATEDAIEAAGFSTFSLLKATRNLRRFFAVLDLFLGIFGSVALAVASLGIINTLVMSVLERRREIGIMKALGASDRDVKRLFFAEAAAMGFLGGVLGVCLGWVIGQVVNLGANLWLQRQELPPERIWSTPWWLALGAIAFAIFVSLLSGLYPAARAARLDPVQALRYE